MAKIVPNASRITVLPSKRFPAATWHLVISCTGSPESQITFLLLAYSFSGARTRAFLHNGKAEARVKDEAGREGNLLPLQP